METNQTPQNPPPLPPSPHPKITNLQIHHPKSTGGALNSYMLYKITFTMSSNKLETYRRYSDFFMLHKVLRRCVPFHYIHPLPPKKTVNKELGLIVNRVEELNNFLGFLLDNFELFDVDAFWKFFDVNIKDTKIGAILGKVSEISWDFVNHKFLEVYEGLYVNQEFDLELGKRIFEFKEKIEVNVEFYRKFLSLIREYINKFIQSPLNQEKKVFFEMLVINYSNNEESFNKLQQNYQEILERNELEFWQFLERKIKMLESELVCYLHIESDFAKLFETNRKEVLNKKSIEKKIDSLEKNPSEMIGVFKKVPKQEKLNDYNQKLNLSNKKLGLYRDLLNVSSKIILENQIDIIKMRKKIRFKETIDIFAKQNIDLYGVKTDFWKSILEENEKNMIEDQNKTKEENLDNGAEDQNNGNLENNDDLENEGNQENLENQGNEENGENLGNEVSDVIGNNEEN